MKPYFYVCRVGHGKTNTKHPSLKEAAFEANRLATMNPNDNFEILQCLGLTRVTSPPPQTFWMDGVIPPHMIETLAIPSHLPPLPPVPNGYSRWEYQGAGWTADNVLYAHTVVGMGSWFVGEGRPCQANGFPDYHYIEAIKEVKP